VKAFRSVDAANIRFLSTDECTRLMNACPSDFRLLVQGALLTGCRYGELTRMVCADFCADGGTLLVRESKSGKPRHVPLTDEGVGFFSHLVAGCRADAIMFQRNDRNPWGKSHQKRPLDAAATHAVVPDVSFHILRHTYGSHLAMKGVPMAVIAAALGHSDTRMTEKHYAHLSPSYIADTIRAHLPSFGIISETNLHVMRNNVSTT
jgi:integrase